MLTYLVVRNYIFRMNARSFSFKNYNCVGFDLDHTITLYQLDNVIQLQYDLLTKYLIKNGYSSDVFPSKLSLDDVDFIQRGLFLDFKKGNILKIASDGRIMRGTHGSIRLNDEELQSVYGKNKKWSLTDQFVSDMMSTWKPPVSDNMRSMMEFFDCQVPLIFAKIIDFVDGQRGGKSEEYSVWPKMLDGIIDMFEPNGGFYEALYEHPELYLRKCSDSILQWMNNLKVNNKLLFLLTGSRAKEASFLASYSLGDDWKKYFDVIVYNAKKPGFFKNDRSFVEQNIVKSDNPLELTQGNWNALYSIISYKLLSDNTKCVYIGDNLIQDIYATSFSSNIHAVALIEEIAEEDIFNKQDIFYRHPFSNYLKSKFWGSYLLSGDGKKLTIWGYLMKQHSKLNIPDLDYLANKSIDHEFKLFWCDCYQN